MKNRRTFLKSLAAVGGVSALPIANTFGTTNTKYDLYNFQQEALDAIDKYRTSLFIWPTASSKSWAYKRAVEKNFGWKDDGSISVISSNKGGLSIFDGLRSNIDRRGTKGLYIGAEEDCDKDLELKQEEIAQIRLDSEVSKLAIFITPTIYNNDWIMQNMHKFDYVDWRNTKSINDSVRKETGSRMGFPEMDETNDYLRSFGCGLVDTEKEELSRGGKLDMDDPTLCHILPHDRIVYIKGEAIEPNKYWIRE